MSLLLTHIALALLLFIIVNWIGKHSSFFGYDQLSFLVTTNESIAFNFVIRVVSPLVYIVIVSSILYALGIDWATNNIHLVVLYYFLIRFLFNIGFGRLRLLNYRKEILNALISTFFSYLLYTNLIITKQRLIPDLNTISNELWVIIAVFLYSVLNQVEPSIQGVEKRKRNYIRHTYNYYKAAYGHIIEAKTADKNIQNLIYSIMIYESFNRPKAARILENILFMIGKSKTLGIMQVTTDEIITDEQSVELGAEKIVNYYNSLYEKPGEKSKDLNSEALESIILKYNPDHNYLNEVISIYEIIEEISVESENES